MVAAEAILILTCPWYEICDSRGEDGGNADVDLLLRAMRSEEYWKCVKGAEALTNRCRSEWTSVCNEIGGWDEFLERNSKYNRAIEDMLLLVHLLASRDSSTIKPDERAKFFEQRELVRSIISALERM